MRSIALITSALILITGCSISVKDHDKKKGSEDVSIKSPIGALNVQTDKVNPADTGMSVFPGSTLKPKDEHNGDNKANVDINTPWFGLKVVAVTYTTDAPVDKVWGYYRDEMSKKWGKPLECRSGSPDMDKKKQNKNDLDCREQDHGMHIDADDSKMQLKVGTEDRQHIVALKTDGGKTQYSLVYVNVRDDKEHDTI
jgi:hypothetical protein